MLRKVTNKKGFVELASPFSIIIFVAVAILIFTLLSVTSSRENEEIKGKVLETNMGETLYAFLAADSGVGADKVVSAVNGGNSTDLEGYALKFFEANNHYWVLFVTDLQGDNIYTISAQKNFRTYDFVKFQNYLGARGLVQSPISEQIIPNPYGEKENIKVILQKVPKYLDERGVEF